MTLNAFDVRPTCDTADVQAILPFPPNPLKNVLCDVPDCGVDANAFKVTMKLQMFLFQTVVTSCVFSICENMVLQIPPIIYTHPVL